VADLLGFPPRHFGMHLIDPKETQKNSNSLRPSAENNVMALCKFANHWNQMFIIKKKGNYVLFDEKPFIIK
jgi:hypothetical protein